MMRPDRASRLTDLGQVRQCPSEIGGRGAVGLRLVLLATEHMCSSLCDRVRRRDDHRPWAGMGTAVERFRDSRGEISRVQ